jgi:hypothetical protein
MVTSTKPSTSFSVYGKTLLTEVRDFFKEGSIFQVVNEDRFEANWRKNLFLSPKRRIENGIRQAVRGSLRKFSIQWAINAFVASLDTRAWQYHSPERSNLFMTAVVAPVVEECLFRGLLQTGIYKAQKWAHNHACSCTKKTKWFRSLTSRPARVLGSTIPFALSHLYRTPFTAASLTQATLMILYPTYALLYETTGNLKYSIGTHMINNFAAWGTKTLGDHS